MRVPWIKVVAAVEVLGGAIGLVLGVEGLSALWSRSPGITFAYFTIFLFTSAAGVLLWIGKPPGWSMSIVTQALQVFSVSVGGWGCQFFAGLLVGAIYDTGNVNLMLGPGAAFIVAVGADPSKTFLAINLVPIVALAILVHARREVARERAA